jgi:hypothetical protein
LPFPLVLDGSREGKPPDHLAVSSDERPLAGGRLTHEHGLSVRAVSDRLRISKTTVATYLLRAREAGLT